MTLSVLAMLLKQRFEIGENEFTHLSCYTCALIIIKITSNVYWCFKAFAPVYENIFSLISKLNNLISAVFNLTVLYLIISLLILAMPATTFLIPRLLIIWFISLSVISWLRLSGAVIVVLNL